MMRLKKKKEEEKKKADAAPPPTAGGGAGGGEGKGEDGIDLDDNLAGRSGRAPRTKSGRKVKAVELRLQKDVVELDGGKVANISFADPDDLTNIQVEITPDEGLWRGQTYMFDIKVPDQYPIKPPECVCRRKIYHPNINWEGRGEYTGTAGLNTTVAL